MDNLDTLAKKVGARIRELREERGLSMEKLSGVELSFFTIQKIESGIGNPTLKVLDLIAKNLEVEPFELFTFNKSKEKDKKR